MKQSERLFAATQPAFGSIGKMLVAIAAMQAILTITSFGQTAGDYRSAGTGNWSTLGTWERYSGSVWATPTSSEGYPGENSGTGNVLIKDGHTVTFNVSLSNSISSLTIGEGVSGILLLPKNSTNSMSIAGALSIASGGKVDVDNTGSSATHTISISGNIVNNGTITLTSSKTVGNVVFNGSGAQNISGNSASMAGVTVTSGSITTNSNGSSSTSLVVNSGGKYIHDNVSSSLAGTTTTRSFADGSTIEIKGHNASALPATTYGNLIINNTNLSAAWNQSGNITSVINNLTITSTGVSGNAFRFNASTNCALTIGGNFSIEGGKVEGTSGGGNISVTVEGNIILSPGSTLSFSPGSGTKTLILKGNWTNSGTFTAGTSTFNMNGTSAQTMSGSTFNNLTIDNSAGVTLLTDEIVNGTLTLTNGRLTLGAYNLTLGTSASISGSPSSSKMIVTNGSGELRKEYSGTGTFTFPVGDNNGPNYSPATINVTSGSFSSAYIGVRVTDAAHPNIGSPTSYITRYWTVTSSGISSFSASCGFVYVDGDIVNSEGIELGRYTSSWTLVGDVDAGTNTLSTFGGISTFGDFTGAEPSAVPVELTSFSGLYRNGRVTLSWKTATEVNNYGFEVQVSHEGEYWTTIGFVEGHGTVNTPQSYSFEDRITDHERSHGTLSYRLRQVDRDGSYTFSPVIMINVGTSPLQVSLFQNYPNPFNPETNIAFILPESQVVSLVVFNAYGREVRKLLDEQEMGAGQHVVPFQTQSLPSGAYVYKLITPEGTMHRVMTISK